MPEPLESLSQSPILQWVLIGGTFVGGAIAVWRAVVGKPNTESSTDILRDMKGVVERLERTIDAGRVEAAATVAATNGLLQGVYRTLQEMRSENARFANERNQKIDEQTDVLRDVVRGVDRLDTRPRRG